METTTVWLHPGFTVSEVDPRIFGGFLEHLGRAVYGGVYDPTSPLADEHGCRRDVLQQLRDLRLTTMRWPGGNFASAYHWRDGIGPAQERPVVREPAWRSAEPNRFGTHEFLDLAEREAWVPMLAVNLGTGSPEEAADWVEYCNAGSPTRYAQQRADHGRGDPWRVPLWCLGNEMDGVWQVGHAPAAEYAWRAHQAATQMRMVDPAIQTIACGSSTPEGATYARWDREVLEILGSQADYLSVHRYVGNMAGDLDDYLCVGASIDRHIEEIDAVCRSVQAERRLPKRVMLCVDEWNVWYRDFQMDGAWQQAPRLLEESYDLADALVVAQFLMSFIRHADVVKIASLAQIVNVLAPVMTRPEGVLVQTTFHPFRMISDRREGRALRVASQGPSMPTKGEGRVPVIDAAAILGREQLHVFLVNRSTNETGSVLIQSTGIEDHSAEAELLTGPSPSTGNTWEQPGVVAPVPVELARGQGGWMVELPPHSFLAASISLRHAPG